jgi:hypothetical protein
VKASLVLISSLLLMLAGSPVTSQPVFSSIWPLLGAVAGEFLVGQAQVTVRTCRPRSRWIAIRRARRSSCTISTANH